MFEKGGGCHATPFGCYSVRAEEGVESVTDPTNIAGINFLDDYSLFRGGSTTLKRKEKFKPGAIQKLDTADGESIGADQLEPLV
ncbi:hypothetical protein GCM10011352_01730 [Marinobacterium zhoushanense]|uniref:Uncharacterized protein n=1 Tax=Marinobacterium zhoushanense TaxID=1679163 RepID=A0ABQ1JW42_9GAMM|nr:hypothetical protein GCM10011352_01730 [Marinobacterium zhoushanense]